MITETSNSLAPLTGEVSAEDITESMGAHRQSEEMTRERAEQDRAEAEEIMAAAREEVARIIAEAEVRARPLTDAATAAERQAAALDERASRLANAAGYAVKAEASEAAVKALEDERDELAGQQAALGGRAAELEAEVQDLERQLSAARESADLDLMASLRTRLGAVRDLVSDLRSRQAPLIARLGEIGDGEMSPLWPQKLLTEARRVAHGDRSTVERALNFAFPERPEAIAEAEAAERLALLNSIGTAPAPRPEWQRRAIDQSGPGTVIRRS